MDLPTKILIYLLATLCVTAYVTGPIVVLIHELGHAIPVLRLGRPVVVEVGHQPPMFSLRAGRLWLHLDPRLDLKQERDHHLGICRFNPEGLTVGQLRSILRGGAYGHAFAGLLFAVGAYWIGNPGSLLFWFAVGGFVGSFWDAISNLVGGKESGQSDGAKLKALRGWDERSRIRRARPPNPSGSGQSAPPPSTRFREPGPAPSERPNSGP